ncbi:hypothetical protein ACFMQL_25530 [Nonomuraea fastidiosa]|uniref:hypothetical protein n=1 Tax=Nonomuraea fastidiosa TaxID=46173 RepID=UPI003672CC6E
MVAVGQGGLTRPPEHEFTSDPEAAALVLGSGAPITVTGLEITTTVRMDASDVAAIAAAGPLGQAFKGEVEQCFLSAAARPSPRDSGDGASWTACRRIDKASVAEAGVTRRMEKAPLRVRSGAPAIPSQHRG